jgi:hypothetical protein
MTSVLHHTSAAHALAEAVETLELASEWLSVDIGGSPPLGTWTTHAQLVANSGSGLTAIVGFQQEQWDDVDASLLWQNGLLTMYPVIEVAAELLAKQRRAVVLDPATLALRLRLDSDEPGVWGVWFRQPRLRVLPDDPIVGAVGVAVVADEDELVRGVVTDVVALMEPLVDIVRPRVSIGRRGLWGTVLDLLVSPLGHQQPDEDPTVPHARVERLLAQAVRTPLEQQVQWINFDHDDRPQTHIRTTSCCMAYKWPVRPDDEPRVDSCDKQWDRYCASCPLIPIDESIHRARYWLDHPDG